MASVVPTSNAIQLVVRIILTRTLKKRGFVGLFSRRCISHSVDTSLNVEIDVRLVLVSISDITTRGCAMIFPGELPRHHGHGCK